MNWPPDPKSWVEFPVECLCYLVPGIVLHLVALVASVVGLIILRMVGRRRPGFSTAMIFQIYLFIFAMIANGIWSCTVWARLYWSVDYVSDFSAFMPILPSQIEYSWGPDMAGGLNGISLAQLNLLWLVFAAPVWILALIATHRTCRARTTPTGEQVVGFNSRPASSLHSESNAAAESR